MWTALERTISLFRDLARGIARDLGYPYPDEMDRQMSAYVREIRLLGIRDASG